jgi:1-phosphofructokinase
VRQLSGKKVILDTSGEGFRQALPASPYLVKPNVDELSEYVGKTLDSPAAIIEQAYHLMDTFHISSVVISMGKQGAIFVEGDERVWAVPPEVAVVSSVGAGDAMVAGIIAGK